MPEKPTSPFAGLDKALLRSTQQSPTTPPEEAHDKPVSTPSELEPATPTPLAVSQTGELASNQAQKRSSNKARRPDSEDASKLASTLAKPDSTVIEVIRKAVKLPGKEVSFVRLTPGEKAQLADIVYTYKRQGKKTSENEINRIAINYILEDYQAYGEQSILARVIEALLA